MRFRPLSRGPFFNPTMKVLKDPDQVFSSPFLGTCFQYIIFADDWEIYEEFSSPFSGTFFSTGIIDADYYGNPKFSSPFSGTFFSKG